jgi:glyoxylase-like metal-dependent hydrolase (beta-lactamase superfamily II)
MAILIYFKPMLQKTLRALPIFLLAASLSASTNFDLQKLADGVYAVIVKPGSSAGSNGAVIITKDEVLVVDTHYRPSFARELIEEIKKLTPNPVRYVVNTHWHNDHVQGNDAYFNVFPKGVELLSHINTRRDIVDKAIPNMRDDLATGTPAAIKQLEERLAANTDPALKPRLEASLADRKAYLAELKSIEISLPTLTFDHSMILHKGGREIRLLYFGRGHTEGDVVVFLPKEKIVITGDLLTSGIPFFRDGHPAEWTATLKGVSHLDFDTAVPGHGPVQTGKSQMGRLIAYMDDLVSGVRKMANEGKSFDEVKATLDLSKHKDGLAGFTPPLGNELAVKRTYDEAKGLVP